MNGTRPARRIAAPSAILHYRILNGACTGVS